jgi:uncharacterized protein (DUF1800 family)
MLMKTFWHLGFMLMFKFRFGFEIRFAPAFTLFILLLTAAGRSAADQYTDPPPPALSIGPVSNSIVHLSLTPYPAGDVFRMWGVDVLGLPWTGDTSGSFSNLTWTAPELATRFYRLEVQPLSSNALLTSTALNRLAYGPTPDLLDRLAASGPDDWIREQLAPETISEHARQATTNIAFIESRFGTPADLIVGTASITTGPGTASLPDLQAWLALNAVFADRQLFEVLTEFWENHFVTWAMKSAMYFTGVQFRDPYPLRAAAELEWREVSGWRQAMLNPNSTFLDMLRVSAQSPAMIIYLDTATSRGNPPNIPNENYSRELMELFTMGVDNGYDQSDITNMAPCWTGWTLELVNVTNAFNPFAPRSTVRKDPSGPNAFTNLVGVWALNFRQNVHAPQAKVIYGGKIVPARFGPPYTTRLYAGNSVPGLYELHIPARSGTNGFKDGYDVITHLANLPFTQEFISVKLCRLLVHDNFSTGSDFTSASLSEEGKLVKACMNAWDNTGGNVRAVLSTIVDSPLFRGNGANAHKVKTPLEYAVSAVRALRQSADGSGLAGTWTATTDGYGLTFSPRGSSASVLMRLGSMSLFNREDPDGYPEAGSSWVSAGALAERVRFVSSLLKASGQTGKNDSNNALNNNITEPVRLLQLRLPASADQRDAGKVADLFLGLFYPGEGRASLDAYRNLAIQYLNTADDGVTASSFSSLTPSGAAGSAYDTRVRGMVAAVLSQQRFNEQ